MEFFVDRQNIALDHTQIAPRLTRLYTVYRSHNA